MHPSDKFPYQGTRQKCIKGNIKNQPFPAENSPSAHGTQSVQQRLLCCFNSCPGLHVLEQLKTVTLDKKQKHVQQNVG